MLLESAAKLVGVKRELHRLEQISFPKLKPGEPERMIALDWTVKALDFAAMLDEARHANKLARRWIGEAVEKESQTRGAKAA